MASTILRSVERNSVCPRAGRYGPDILTSNRVSATHPLTRRSQTSGNALQLEAVFLGNG
jgi:hypothetical protein